MTGPVMSRVVHVAGMPADGGVQTVESTPGERTAIAGAFGLLELKRLEARIETTRHKGTTIDLEGRLRAEVVQACVVTLEPVTQVIDTTFSRRFIPETAMGGREAEIVVEADEADLPDSYADGRIDLGAVVVEELALAIDPYPRAPGAEFATGPEPGEPAPDSPFAALADMKPPRRK